MWERARVLETHVSGYYLPQGVIFMSRKYSGAESCEWRTERVARRAASAVRSSAFLIVGSFMAGELLYSGFQSYS